MESFRFKENKIHYRVSGNGNPVIFLHGFLENHKMWQAISPPIEALGCQVFLIDLPGHGESRFSGEICSMQLMAEIIAHFCKEFALHNPFVFGHSMGGYVGLELLNIYPVRLTLLHSNFWDDPSSKKRDRDRVIEIVKTNKLRLIHEAIPHLFTPANRNKCKLVIAALIKEAAKIPSSEIIAVTKGMRDRSNHKQIMEQHAIHIIHGELDEIVKSTLLDQKLSHLTKQPEVIRFADCGHMSIWENPEQLINSLKLIVFR